MKRLNPLAILNCLLSGLALVLTLSACTQEKSPLDTTHSDSTTQSGSPDTIISSIYKAHPSHSQISEHRKLRRPAPSSNRTVPTSGTHVFGKIRKTDGSPAAGASVSIMGFTGSAHVQMEEVATTVTLADGFYRISTDVEKTFYLKLKGDLPELLVPLFDRDAPIDRSKKIERNITIPDSHPLTGMIVNEHNHPVGGASVQLQRHNQINSSDNFIVQPPSTTSTATGEFHFEHVVAGNFFAGVRADGYASVSAEVVVPTSQTLIMRLGNRGGTVRGRVLHKDSNVPVPAVSLRLTPQGATARNMVDILVQTTDAAGAFQFDNVSAGPNQIFIYPHETGLGIAPPAPGTIQVNESETTEVVLYVYPGYTVHGTVYDAATSNPLSNVIVMDSRNSNQAVSDVNGSYTLTGIFPHINGRSPELYVKSDNYSLAASEDGRQTISVPIIENELVVKQDIPMTPKLTVSGHVETEDGMPVSIGSAQFVKAMGGIVEQPVSLKEDGSFNLKVPANQHGHVKITAEGYAAAASQVLSVETRDITGIKIVLQTGCTVTGTVLLPDGKPAPNAEIIHRVTQDSAVGQSVSMESIAKADSEGKFTLTGMPRNVEIAARLKPYADSDYTAMMLETGEIRSDIVLNLKSSQNISGRVLDSNHNPIPSMSVQTGDMSVGKHATTDAKGEFTLTGLPEGSYTITAYGPEGRKAVNGVASGATDVEIVLDKLDTYTLIGTVKDQISGGLIDDYEVAEAVVQRQGQGKFRLEGIRKDIPKQLRISSSEHRQQTFTLRPPKTGDQLEMTFELGTEGVVSGRVIDAETKAPVANVTVTCWGNTPNAQAGQAESRGSAKTDADGRFVIGPVPSGQNNVQFQAEQTYNETYQMVDVISEQNNDMGEILLKKAGGIQGQVVRSSDNAPMSGVTVYCGTALNGIPKLRQVAADAEGRFEFSDLGGNFCSLRVDTTSRQIKLEPGKTTNVVMTVGSTTMKGQILHGSKGVMAGFQVKGPEQYYRGNSTEGGLYEIKGIAPGRYTVSINAPGANLTEELTVPDQTEFSKNFILPEN